MNVTEDWNGKLRDFKDVVRELYREVGECVSMDRKSFVSFIQKRVFRIDIKDGERFYKYVWIWNTCAAKEILENYFDRKYEFLDPNDETVIIFEKLLNSIVVKQNNIYYFGFIDFNNDELLYEKIKDFVEKNSSKNVETKTTPKNMYQLNKAVNEHANLIIQVNLNDLYLWVRIACLGFLFKRAKNILSSGIIEVDCLSLLYAIDEFLSVESLRKHLFPFVVRNNQFIRDAYDYNTNYIELVRNSK